MSLAAWSGAVPRACASTPVSRRPSVSASGSAPASARRILPFPQRLAALAVIAACGAAHAQDVPGATASPTEGPASQRVAITATRVEVPVNETVADVSVLTREDLERDTGLTLAQVLATLPGVQLTSNGGRGTSTGVYLRGMEARHTVLLVDGVRVDSATLGLPSFDNLPLSLVDRIEVVRGPLCALYGADAAGGVVQVFTRRGGQKPTGHAELVAGSHGYRDVQAGVAVGQGGFDLAVDGSHVQDAGFSATNPKEPFGSYNPDRDGFDQDAGSVRAGWDFAPGWRLEGLALQSAGLVHYDDGPGVDSRARLRNGVQAATLSGHPMPAWRTSLQFARSVDEYVTVASSYGGEGTIRTLERRVSWENAVDTAVGTALGVLERTTQDVAKPGDPYDVMHREIDGATLALNGSAGGHTWQASLRRDRNTQFGRQTTGGLAYAYAFTPALEAGAAYGTSFVAPSFNQLYYPGYGNPALQPERGHSTELHARWHDDRQSLRLVGYRQRMRGYITPGQDPVNIDRVSIDGLTVAWERRWEDTSVGVAYDHLDPRDDTDHTALRRRARNDAKANADWDVGAWTLGGTWTAYSSRLDVGGYDANDAPIPVKLGAYATLDLRADWKFARDWSLGLRVNNATDKVYETAYGYNQPRREGYLVLSWQAH